MATVSTERPSFELPPGCDPNASWMMDAMHFPRPLPLLSQEILGTTLRDAFKLDVTFVNGFGYARDYAPPPPTAEVMEKGAVPIWENEFVPRIAEFCSNIRRADYTAIPAAELAGRLPGIFRDAAKAFEYTMIVVFPFMGPTLAAVEYGEQVLGADGPLLVGSLLQGYENETSAAGWGLNELGNLAAGFPEVAAALREGRTEDLAGVNGGPEFLSRLDAYLADYGWRLDDWAQMHVPTWAEDHSTPLRLIGSFLAEDTGSPGASIRRSGELREEAEREVRSRLSGQPLEQLMGMIAVARPHVSMSEGRARWQLTIAGSLRVPILALGQRLQAAGALEDPNDAFYLGAEELERAAAQPAGTKDLVRQRKDLFASQLAMTPPPFLGAPPAMEGLPPEVLSVFKRFFGLGIEPSADGGLVRGNPASGGTARGRARVIRSLDDADRLEPGDILVCTLTAPPWTPLFAIAAGVVTDTGGVISHSAICAREFAIPCVVGTQIGTSVIPDGAMVTVDGDAGTVKIES